MRKELKIGIFVVVVITVSFFLINYLRGKDIFNREIELYSNFETVEGLLPSAPVFIRGYKAGKVAEVVYDAEKEDFTVICSIKKEFRIPEDSKMTIYSVDIMGGKGVRIDLGTSEVSAEDGSTLAPAFEAGLMDGLSAGIAPLLAKVTSTLDSLELTISGINSVLSDENQANITKTMAHLERTMASIESIAVGIDGKSAELTAFIDNLSDISGKFTSISAKIDTTMSGVSSVVATLDESDIEGLVTSFKSLLEKINDPEGTVGKLLTDGSVYTSIDELLNDVDSLVKKIEENPKKYVRISVF